MSWNYHIPIYFPWFSWGTMISPYIFHICPYIYHIGIIHVQHLFSGSIRRPMLWRFMYRSNTKAARRRVAAAYGQCHKRKKTLSWDFDPKIWKNNIITYVYIYIMKLGGSYITKRIYISWRGLLFGDWFLVFRKLCHSFHHFPWPWACQDEKWLYHRTDIMAMARVRVLTPTTRGGLHRFSIGKTPCSEDWQKKLHRKTPPQVFSHTCTT